MGKILIVDDDIAFLKILGAFINENYPNLEVITSPMPLEALNLIRQGGLDLLVLDLEMPEIDGAKIFRFAIDNGMDSKRIVILSAKGSDYLHAHFPLGTCLAVLNKFEVKQKAVLQMVFSSLDRKAGERRAAPGKSSRNTN
jgi:CheY-like chemotaxis protein